MGSEVFANGNAIAAKTGGGKVIAAFPDVCLSPPSPPAGPIPVPYPDSSFSTDLQEGSKTVTVGGKPAALQDQSYYKSSPLGNEAATKSFGASVLTHVNAGKTYFVAFSMNVQFEGKFVCRHIDLTTSNHGSLPGGTPPVPNLENIHPDTLAKDPDKCACCDAAKHAEGKPQSGKEWYEGEINKKQDHVISEATTRAGPPPLSKGAAKKLAGKIAGHNQRRQERLKDLEKLLDDATKRPGCVCPKPAPNILPSSPCDTFYETQDDKTKREAQREAVDKAYLDFKDAAWKQAPQDRPAALKGMTGTSEYMHKTPRTAGGCPTGEGNLQDKTELCQPCKDIDTSFNDFQGGWR